MKKTEIEKILDIQYKKEVFKLNDNLSELIYYVTNDETFEEIVTRILTGDDSVGIELKSFCYKLGFNVISLEELTSFISNYFYDDCYFDFFKNQYGYWDIESGHVTQDVKLFLNNAKQNAEKRLLIQARRNERVTK